MKPGGIIGCGIDLYKAIYFHYRHPQETPALTVLDGDRKNATCPYLAHDLHPVIGFNQPGTKTHFVVF